MRVDRAKLENPFHDDQPPCDVPVYAIDEWRRMHGDVMPDHPCMFAAEQKTAFQVHELLTRKMNETIVCVSFVQQSRSCQRFQDHAARYDKALQNIAHELVFSHVPKQAMLDYPGITELLEDFGNETVTTQPGLFAEFFECQRPFHIIHAHIHTHSVCIAHHMPHLFIECALYTIIHTHIYTLHTFSVNCTHACNLLSVGTMIPIILPPGYAQAGGHFHYVNPKSRVGDVWRLRDLANAWNSTHIGHYYSEFDCKTHLCQVRPHTLRPNRAVMASPRDMA